jgi:hypothetical protein
MASPKRVFEINEDVSSSLEKVQKGLGASTGAEALRRSIKLTEAMVKLRGNKDEVYVLDADGNKTRLVW